MGIGASRAKVYDEERPTTRFADVAGYEGAKREISEVVDFLTHPERYAAAGALTPRGVLMVGPPGTGKTLLARAVAGEASVPFFALTGSSFVELFVGVGAARMRDLFTAARKVAPAIIFIDEIDAIGQRRGAGYVSNDEREQTLNQLLAEMDGFEPTAQCGRAGGDESSRDAGPRVAAARPVRPPSRDPAAEPPGTRRHSRDPRARQAPRRGRRRRRDRTRDSWLLGCRPRESGQRGRDRRRARRADHDHRSRFCRSSRSHPPRPPRRHQRVDARREARGCRPRVRARARLPRCHRTPTPSPRSRSCPPVRRSG